MPLRDGLTMTAKRLRKEVRILSTRNTERLTMRTSVISIMKNLNNIWNTLRRKKEQNTKSTQRY